LDHTLILIGSGCLVCLMPVAIYLLYLSHLNSRTPPTLVPGPWDFAGVLLALSGFLLLSGPLLLTLVNSVWRYYAFGNWANLKFVSSREAWAASLIVTGYVIILAASITFLLRRRRPVTAIYNVEPLGLEGGLVAVLDELGFAWRRVNARIEIGTKKRTEPFEPDNRFVSGDTATVRIDTFPSTAHATLRWGGAYEDVRREVESVLPRALPSSARNPVAGWMFTAAVSVMVVMLLWLIVLVVVIVDPKHG
jgi:hypothetical protein